jgi:hypothetical protein
MTISRTTERLAEAALAALVSLSLSCAPAAGQTAPSESALKVAFIFNFLKFTQWPATSFAGDKDAIVLCVLAGSDLDGPLETLRNRTVQNRIIVIRRTAADEVGAGACHVAYFGSNRPASAGLGKPANATVTIGDSPSFAARGGMINFYRADGRLRFEINAQVARDGQIHFSPDLLTLAKIVQTDRG